MNLRGIKAIYEYEMSRTFRTITQSIASPVLSTALYFIVFGSAIGSRIENIDGISYVSFIVPGLIMLTILIRIYPAGMYPVSQICMVCLMMPKVLIRIYQSGMYQM